MYCRCNPDEDIRRLERLAAQGDIDAEIRLRVARHRAGEPTNFVPPSHVNNVLDRQGGITIQTFTGRGSLRSPSTLRRPGRVIHYSQEGELVRHESGRFYQTIEPVTWAYYRVPGYNRLVIIYWNEITGERVT